jgi:putative spermidine/putrescine transport system permease protein
MANTIHEASTARIRKEAIRHPIRARSMAWLPVTPFFLYVALFLLIPTVVLVAGAFQTESGRWTLDNVRALFANQYANAYLTSVGISVTTALIGTVCGFFVAYAAIKEGAPRWIRALLSTFAGVAANFAGVPLAFAFVATLGTTGFITVFLRDHGLDLYQGGFTLYSFFGLALVYTYFQLPLMILLISPALDGLRREWTEAAASLGATPLEFWRWVGLPILWPALLGALVLLFGNAFAAYATATALVGSQIGLVPILIGRVTTGDFASNPQIANALSLGMVIIISAAMVVYGALQRRSRRWLR